MSDLVGGTVTVLGAEVIGAFVGAAFLAGTTVLANATTTNDATALSVPSYAPPGLKTALLATTLYVPAFHGAVKVPDQVPVELVVPVYNAAAGLYG